MKKTKLLFPALGLVPLVGASVGTIIGCSCKTTTEYILAAEKDIYIVGNEVYNYFEFTLNQDLKSGQTLTTNIQDTDYFKFGNPVVENRLVKLPAVWSQKNVTSSTTWKENITFTCNNSDGSKAWSQKINNCSVTYTPNIILSSEKDGYTDEISTNEKTITGHFYFELGEQLEYILELKPYFTIHSDTTVYSIDESKTEITTDGKTADLKLVINKNGTEFAIGDKFSFDVQIECVVKDTTWTYWQSTKFTNMSLSYNSIENPLDPATDFELEAASGGGYILTGIKGVNSDKNTLLIPAASSGTWIKQIGKGDNAINLPSSITKIKIAGLGLQTIAANAFNGNTNIKYIDLSAVTDSVKSLDEILQFGDDSFANWSLEGRVIYNKDLSQYKRHIIKQKLYKAGLTSNGWYGVTLVDSEEKLREAAYMGGNIQLTKDIEISAKTGAKKFTGQIDFYTSSILDLNGHKITSKEPIFNTDTAEFATIGIWDCEVVVTDSNAMQSGKEWNDIGGIYAYDNSAINDESQKTSKPQSVRPAAPQEGEEPIKDNPYWEYSADAKGNLRYRPREHRCFYVRSDIPTRAKGTLEILTGKFVGNCTCIMNYNTTVYIEDGFVPESEKTEPETNYKAVWAPTFDLYSVCFDDLSKQYVFPTPCKEMLNCWEDTVRSGEATFQVWGGKFLSHINSSSSADYFNPEFSYADETPVYDVDKTIIGYQKANWCEYNLPNGITDRFLYSKMRKVESGVNPPYYLAIPMFSNY